MTCFLSLTFLFNDFQDASFLGGWDRVYLAYRIIPKPPSLALAPGDCTVNVG